MDLGEWTQPELAELRLTHEEELQLYEEYIPQYFKDDAPLNITMAGAFRYTRGSESWDSFDTKKCPVEAEASVPSCGVLTHCFYIGADGMVCPCMGMADTTYAPNFPNLFESPLSEILGDSEFNRLCHASVADVRDGSGRCRDCAFVNRCAGGCRNAALIDSGNYYGADPEACWFFEHDGEERIRQAAEKPLQAYLRRNPIQPKQDTPDGNMKECI